MKKGLNVDSRAKHFCDGLWDSYRAKYPKFKDRITAIFFHMAIYQQLVNHRSGSDSNGRQLQLELIQSFEAWYPNIEHAREIDWIDLDREVLDTIQAETGDYSYGFDPSGSHVRDYDTRQAWEISINHQLFQVLPISKAVIEQTNQNQEIIRQIQNQLVDFYPSPINSSIPGEQELYDLMVDDVSRLLIGVPHNSGTAQQLDVYLYLFQSAMLSNDKSKQECAQLASLIRAKVKSIQNEGSVPRAIESIWQMGFGYSDELVKDYNQFISLLDGSLCTIHREDITDGFKVSVWRYPDKEATLQKVIVRGGGHFELVGETQLSFDDAKALAALLMMTSDTHSVQNPVSGQYR
ncbi:hypothetical protein [Vibrio parahaemolyticus]|uniref:hypothetical protein n=1 Tax=Vibrio parahaemolyticus TaxID=670 RepID=UPI0023609B10|nr:hypothetical protein [Vibrio parahaemolyticus]